MNFVEQDKDYCGKEGQEEEEEEEEVMMTRSKLPFSFPPSSSSPSPSSSSTKYRNFMLQNQNLWLPSSDQTRQTSINFDNKLELTDLSLGNENRGGGSESTEREHMFDKVVTPSDVGKLNRLVIPKQHAEKYFPLDSSSNEKGLLLNFEDRNGKPWRFRYSYWNSSQSYVMTKGWSRFVKEKKLDAGDIVSFQRGVGESGKHRLYIDWRRRPNAPDPTSFSHLELQNQLHFPPSVRWGRLYSLPQPLSIPRPYEQSQFHHLNYHHRYHNYHPQATPHQYYLRPPAGALQIGTAHQHGGGEQPQMVIDSVPVVHGKSVGKRLRLFGVNMECPTQDDQSYSNSSSGNLLHVGSFSPHHHFVSSSSLPLPQYQSTILLPSSSSGGPMPTTEAYHELSKKGKTSLSFDLDL